MNTEDPGTSLEEFISIYGRERAPRDGEINGYCVGDRIAVIDGPNKGWNGHIVHLSSGCAFNSWCRESCLLVYVLHDAETAHEWSSLDRFGDVVEFTFNERYKFPEITHVD
jgi:hypothetical protein